MRFIYLKQEHFRTIKKTLLSELSMFYFFSYLFYKRSIKYTNKITRYRNRCLISGCYRTTNALTVLSRTVFKRLASNGFIVGIKVAS
jgi:ribosomal protein S14